MDVGAVRNHNRRSVGITAGTHKTPECHIIQPDKLSPVDKGAPPEIFVAVDDDCRTGNTGDGQDLPFASCGEDTELFFVNTSGNKHRISGPRLFDGGVDFRKRLSPAAAVVDASAFGGNINGPGRILDRC